MIAASTAGASGQRCHNNKVPGTKPSSNAEAPAKPMPGARVAESAIVVPDVVEAIIVAQYSHGRKRAAATRRQTRISNAPTNRW